MVLRLTSPKITTAREPRDENLLPEDERDANLGGRSPRAVQDSAAGPRELRSQKMVGAEVALDWVLQEIVQQARLATTATGAFIGLVRGHKIVCQATSGANAGEFVAYLNRDRRMVDSCLRNSAVQLCRDSETSEELEGSACRYLGARSVVIVPVLDETEEKLGIFGVFSPQVDAFSSTNVVALQSLSRRIADAMAQVERSTSASSGGASAPLRTNIGKSSMTRAPLLRAALRPRMAVRSSALWIVGILAVVVLVGWTVSRAINQRAMQTSAQTPAAVTAQADSSLPAQPSSDQESSDHASSDHPSSDNPSSESADKNPRPSPAVAAVVKPQSAAAEANVKPVNVKPGTDAAPARKAVKKITAAADLHRVPDLEIENTLDDASSGSLPESVSTTKASNPSSTIAALRLTGPEKKAASINTGSPPVLSNAPSGQPPRDAIHLTRDPDPQGVNTTPPPNQPVQNASPMSTGSLLGGPVVLPEKAALERVVDRVKPDYPQDAMTQQVQGAVTMDVVVGKDGQVEGVTPVDGDARLQASAAKALQKWSFAPLLRNGHFVKFETHITLHFALP
jgi:TonB family protein